MRNLSALRRLGFSSFLVSTALACGSRTGLFGDDDSPFRGTSSGVSSSSGFTSSSGAIIDGSVFFDGGIPIPDDAPSTIDARPVPPDVFREDCPPEQLLVYVISNDNELLSFNPEDGAFKSIGRITCPTADPGYTPFSMAVDRKGTAYILFTDERIYRVSTATGACIATSYVPRQLNFARFGMGFATNSVGPTEFLFVAGDEENVAPGQPTGADGLAQIDPKTFQLSYIGSDPTMRQAELTGTGDGRLFAFFRDSQDSATANIGEVDTKSGLIGGTRHFDSVDMGSGWAFAFWGGDFYMFHAPEGTTRITRWRPRDNSVATVATTSPGTVIVGAGVSTCAPQQ
jgi:hypothetical protein